MKKVLLRAPILTQSGYGHHARTVLRALRTREDLFDVYLHAINWGTTSWMWEDSDERRWIDSRLEKTMNYVNVFFVQIRTEIITEAIGSDQKSNEAKSKYACNGIDIKELVSMIN